MNQILISFILPVYNVEKYIERAILSIVEKQKGLDHYEIICIDDGSLDNSKQIILDLKRIYPQITLISQQNSGVAKARNEGLNQAKGNYIMFLDPDDFYVPNTLGVLLSFAIDNDLEVVNFNYSYTKENSLEVENNNNSYKVLNQIEFYKNNQFPPFCWAYLFHRNIFTSLRFNENLTVGEDCLLVESACLNAIKFGYTNIVVYGYFNNPNSVMRSLGNQNKNRIFIENYFKGIIEIKSLYKNNTNPSLQDFINIRIENRIYNLIMHARQRKISFAVISNYLKLLDFEKFKYLKDDYKIGFGYTLRKLLINNKLIFKLIFKY